MQNLEANDPPRRIEFCNYFVNRQQEDPNFYRKILWSDECTFSNNGLFNRNHHYYWSTENPRNIRENRFQRRFSVNVWCGILNGRLLGPYFIDGTLNSVRYNQFLRNQLQVYLEQLPLAEFNHVIFQQDGASVHNSLINTNFLNENFGQNWIGTNGPIQWPARSPDLTPLDFFLWGHLKDLVFVTPPENIDDLRVRIRNACQSIPQDMLINAARSVNRRCQICIANNGLHIEHLL